MMPVPWLQLIDAALGLANFARGRRAAVEPGDEQQQQQQLESAARTPGGLEARMAGVVVAALKEAFDRDSRRLELEREQAAVERERMERALRLELQRQAADREIGRLRMLAAVAVAGWIGTLLLAMLPGGIMRAGTIAKVALGGGWLLLGAAVATSFTAQGRVASVLASLTAEGVTGAASAPSAGGESTALWLLVAGLILVGIAILVG